MGIGEGGGKGLGVGGGGGHCDWEHTGSQMIMGERVHTI
jgi:hypothetical protein